MRGRSPWQITAPLWVLALLPALAASPAAAESRDGVATLTIHNRVCPLESEGPDFFGVCHDDPIAGMPFFVDGPITRHATTDADGNATFARLPPARYAVVGGPPGDFVRNAIFCAPAAAPGTPFPFVETSIVGIEIDLAAGDDVVCDWYSVPEDRRGGATSASVGGQDGTARLTIHYRVCPSNSTGQTR